MINHYSEHANFENHLILDYGPPYGYLNVLLQKLKTCTAVRVT